MPELISAISDLHYKPRNGISFHSFECWKDDQLVAGDIGFTNGSIFSGLTRFHNIGSSGSVLLASTAMLLKNAGFHIFDMGMPYPYKEKVGCEMLYRKKFLRIYRAMRKISKSFPAQEKKLAYEILRGNF